MPTCEPWKVRVPIRPGEPTNMRVPKPKGVQPYYERVPYLRGEPCSM